MLVISTSLNFSGKTNFCPGRMFNIVVIMLDIIKKQVVYNILLTAIMFVLHNYMHQQLHTHIIYIKTEPIRLIIRTWKSDGPKVEHNLYCVHSTLCSSASSILWGLHK